MTDVFIEDSPRNVVNAWASEVIDAGLAAGAILTPFCTPRIGNTYKPGGLRIAESLRGAGGESWFDATTHALQMPGVGDFRYYEQWDLWGDEPGALLTRAQRRDHVRRVLDTQDGLGSQTLAPTILMNSASGNEGSVAVDLLEEAIAYDDECWGSIAGTAGFWAAGDDLDAVIGAFAALNRPGWFLTVVRTNGDLPVHATQEEIAGLCRTARSLSQDESYVHISHGDLSGLPAIAAGASSVGTGWDTRQRVCHFGSYATREPSGGGGAWFQRPTIEDLFAVMRRQDVERLFARDVDFAQSIFEGPLHPDGAKENFLHHVETLSRLVDTLRTSDLRRRFRRLDSLYEEATANWATVATLAQIPDHAKHWVTPLHAGLRDYADVEGWL